MLEYMDRPGWWKADRQAMLKGARCRAALVATAAVVVPIAVPVAAQAATAPAQAVAAHAVDPHGKTLPGGIGQYTPSARGGNVQRD